MRDSSDNDHPESGHESRAELHSDMHPDWALLAAPLDPPALDALIERAISQRAPSKARLAKVSFLRPRRWLPTIVAVGALAAGLSLVVRTEDPVDLFELEMRPGHTQRRGEAPRADPSFYDLRNEPLWTVHVSGRRAAEGLQLYLLAQTESGLELLKPQIERRSTAFRVLGELGELGLRPGDVTLHFVLGPRSGEAEVVSRLGAQLAGAALPSPWQLQSRSIHITP